MQLKQLGLKGWQLARRQRRLIQAALVGLAVAGLISLAQWAGLFSSMQDRASDYLYDTEGFAGDDILIVAIDEKSQSALGEWPWTVDRYALLFERLSEAKVVGFDILLADPGPEGNPETAALLEAARRADNVVMPLTAPIPSVKSTDVMYSIWHDQAVRPFPALLAAAADAGSVAVRPDNDGTLRRVPLLVSVDERDRQGQKVRTVEIWEAFGLRVLRLWLGLGDTPISLVEDRVVIGDKTEITYEVPTDANGVMLVNFVGRPNTFTSYSFVDVIEDRVDRSIFEDKVVLVGMMNSLNEMDLHRTPVSAGRMAGIEFQANVIHTLFHHRPLVSQSGTTTTITVVLLALVSALVLSQLEAVPGAIFTLLLGLGYFVFTSLQFSAGRVPNVLFPYVTIFVNYAALTATRFASERGERRQVTDIFGRFVSAEVRDAIMNLALEDPDLIQPGGRQMEISVLFADIRGFTTISENLPPPEVVEILNQYLHSMEEEVFKQGGTLDKYTGDGMMVIFGAPLEQPDHAERAVRAALGMQQAAAEVSRRRGDARWKIAYGIGITTGPAVVGHIGSQRRLDYTAIGDTVNLAARLEGKAPAGTILINRATYEAVKGVAAAEELEPMMVKGKAKPVTVYRVVGLREEVAADVAAVR